MDDRTRLGAMIVLFGILLVSVILLIKQVIPPVRVLPGDSDDTNIPQELLGDMYEMRYMDMMPYGGYKEIHDRRRDRIREHVVQYDASGNRLF